VQAKREQQRQAMPGAALDQGMATSIVPSAVTLTWLVPASTSGVGAASARAAYIIMTGARM